MAVVRNLTIEPTLVRGGLMRRQDLFWTVTTQCIRLWRPVLTVAVGVALLTSGYIHLLQPYAFVVSMSAYRLVPGEVAAAAGIILPALHLVLGVYMLCGIAVRLTLLLSGGLFLTYGGAQALVLLRGEAVSCGCFGHSTKPIGPDSLAIPIVCLLLCGVLLATRDAHSQENLLPGG